MGVVIGSGTISGLADSTSITYGSIVSKNFANFYYAGNNEGATVGVTLMHVMPYGSVILFGRHIIGSDTTVTVTFPATFNVNSVHVGWHTSPDNTTDYWTPKVTAYTTSNITLRNTNTYASFWVCYWATGYL